MNTRTEDINSDVRYVSGRHLCLSVEMDYGMPEHSCSHANFISQKRARIPWQTTIAIDWHGFTAFLEVQLDNPCEKMLPLTRDEHLHTRKWEFLHAMMHGPGCSILLDIHLLRHVRTCVSRKRQPC